MQELDIIYLVRRVLVLLPTKALRLLNDQLYFLVRKGILDKVLLIELSVLFRSLI